jgi:hypothetical protein
VVRANGLQGKPPGNGSCTAPGIWGTGLNPTRPWRRVEAVGGGSQPG